VLAGARGSPPQPRFTTGKGAIHEEESQEGRQENPEKGKITIVDFAQGRGLSRPSFFHADPAKNKIRPPRFLISASSLTLTNNSLQMGIACVTE
jgi:hypothetical protein